MNTESTIKITTVFGDGPLHFTKLSHPKARPTERFREPWLSKRGRNQIWTRVGTWKNCTVETASETGLEAPTALRTGERPLGMESSPLVLKEITPGAHSISQVFRRPLQVQGSDLGGISAVHLAKFGFDERTGELGLTQVGTLSLP